MLPVTKFYRDLHQIPELSNQEFDTALYVEDALRSWGFSPRRVGQTGVTADLAVGEHLPWILLRADMDALPGEEESCAAEPSRHNGVMHSCGHDAHMAMLLAAAERLAGEKAPQNIRFLFQPAEETTQGAAQMIAHGVLPDHLLACFSLHVWPGVPLGRLAVRSGAMMASSDVYRVSISGKSAHCAQAAKGADALRSAVSLAARLPQIKEIAEHPDTILFCGSIHSGNSHNIVPDQAALRGTIRSFSEEDRSLIKAALERELYAVTKTFGTTGELTWDGGCPVVHNSDVLIKEMVSIFPDLMTDAAPSLAAEDFALYQQHAPGVLTWLGTGATPPLHSSSFFVPEEILPLGQKFWESISRWDWAKAAVR